MPKKKIEKAKTAPVQTTTSTIVKTAADQIWSEIKDLEIKMFALPDQRVHMYCKPVSIDPNKLFLLASAGSVLTALELVVAPKYVVEKMDRFLVVTLAPSPFAR